MDIPIWPRPKSEYKHSAAQLNCSTSDVRCSPHVASPVKKIWIGEKADARCFHSAPCLRSKTVEQLNHTISTSAKTLEVIARLQARSPTTLGKAWNGAP